MSELTPAQGQALLRVEMAKTMGEPLALVDGRAYETSYGTPVSGAVIPASTLRVLTERNWIEIASGSGRVPTILLSPEGRRLHEQERKVPVARA